MSSQTKTTLHITNGDVAAERIRQSGLGGEVLAWRDALHEGPVPSGLSLDEMSRVRARFLAERLSSDPYDRLVHVFAERDSVLKSFRRRDRVVLWFDHDLYDQLQLIQLLHWFKLREAAGTRLELICIGEHPGVEDFRGLGQLTPQQIAELYQRRIEVGAAHLDVGDRGWEAFCSDRPTRLQELMREDLSALPFLRAAILRHFEQFPSTRDGLSRSERQILESLDAEISDLASVFRSSQQEREERPFMADWPFVLHFGFLHVGEEPLVEFEDGAGLSALTGPPYSDEFWARRVRITEPGRKVLMGQVDRLRYQMIDRWLGGVHLEGEPAWRWGHRNHEIVAQGK